MHNTCECVRIIFCKYVHICVYYICLCHVFILCVCVCVYLGVYTRTYIRMFNHRYGSMCVCHNEPCYVIKYNVYNMYVLTLCSSDD